MITLPDRIPLCAAAIALFAVSGLAAPQARAAGTPAGALLTTDYTLSFKVGGIAQQPLTNQYTRVVDQVVNLSVEVVNTLPVTVAPQQTNVMTTLRVKNLSNAPMSFSPTLFEDNSPANGFPANIYRVYRDTNGNGLFDAGTDQLIGENGVDGTAPYIYAPLIAPEATDTWFAFADIPAEAAPLNGQTVSYTVLAVALDLDAVTNGRRWTSYSYFDREDKMDNYLADAAGPADDASSGDLSVSLNFLVASASLSAQRFSKVLSDLVNGTTNPKAIPGALVEYCLAITNAAGGATASDVAVADTVSSNLTIDNSFGVRVNGTFSNGTCNADGISGGSINGSVVSGTIPTLNGGDTKTVIYRATVN